MPRISTSSKQSFLVDLFLTFDESDLWSDKTAEKMKSRLKRNHVKQGDLFYNMKVLSVKNGKVSVHKTIGMFGCRDYFRSMAKNAFSDLSAVGINPNAFSFPGDKRKDIPASSAIINLYGYGSLVPGFMKKIDFDSVIKLFDVYAAMVDIIFHPSLADLKKARKYKMLWPAGSYNKYKSGERKDPGASSSYDSYDIDDKSPHFSYDALSAGWVTNPVVATMVFGLTRGVLANSILNGDKIKGIVSEIDTKSVRKIVNTANREKAIKFILEFHKEYGSKVFSKTTTGSGLTHRRFIKMVKYIDEYRLSWKHANLSLYHYGSYGCGVADFVRNMEKEKWAEPSQLKSNYVVRRN